MTCHDNHDSTLQHLTDCSPALEGDVAAASRRDWGLGVTSRHTEHRSSGSALRLSLSLFLLPSLPLFTVKGFTKNRNGWGRAALVNVSKEDYYATACGHNL